jgi:lipopolysaccharide/colanic/teichoic acid biosynthesis glycosyltransferase
MQRIFDVIFSLLAIIVLSPMLFVIIIFLKVTGEGEVFFLQDRVGKNGSYFKLYKFATMLKNSAALDTGTLTVKNDRRILPVGKFLRDTKINELPQLLNIFLGDMSFIGPRPLTDQSFNAYPKEIQSLVVKVTPGLSGIGSIIFRDEENIMSDVSNNLNFYNEVVAPYKGSLEVWYTNNKTIPIYFQLIILTLMIVFLPKSQLAWKLFKDLPKPPVNLESLLNYTNTK